MVQDCDESVVVRRADVAMCGKISAQQTIGFTCAL